MTEHAPNKNCIGCGDCCKSLPGAFHPNDRTMEQFIELLRIGVASIDWYEGDELTYYVRPATLSGRNTLMDPSWGGECVNLGPTGCGLTRDDMPSECRELRPTWVKGGDCIGGGKRRIAELWSPHQEALLKAIEQLKERYHDMG